MLLRVRLIFLRKCSCIAAVVKLTGQKCPARRKPRQGASGNQHLFSVLKSALPFHRLTPKSLRFRKEDFRQAGKSCFHWSSVEFTGDHWSSVEFEVQQSSVVESPMSSGAPGDIHHGRLRATLRRAKAKMGGQKTRELQLAASSCK